MSYLRALYSTYEHNEDKVGELATNQLKDGRIVEYMLLPISHTTQTAHIEVTVNIDGTLFDAEVKKSSTILPFTEESGSRSGKNYVPHVLHDKLMYVAGDYVTYTNDKEKEDCFKKYIEQLKEWCDSPYGHPHIRAIYDYVKNGTLIKDLVNRKILHVDEGNGYLLLKWNGKSEEKPSIFTVIAGEQISALVRFNIHIPGEVTKPIWRDKEIFESYINFYNTKLKEEDICYVSGESSPIIIRHPNKLRNSGDKAKLISANDSSGFTYRGRFNDSFEAANISYDVSQKAHNVLKWLIERQGKTIDGRVFLIWGSKNPDIPSVTEDLSEESYDDLNYLLMGHDNAERKVSTKETLASQLREIIKGIKRTVNISDNEEEKIYILTLDAATPGRLAVLYYRDYHIDEYLKKLMNWHVTASWRQIYKKDNQLVEYYGSPSFLTIARAAYGPRPNEKVVKGVMERLLPCVLDGRKVPIDIIRNSIIRASNPQFFENSWEWEQALTVACSLVKKHYEKEEFRVALNKENSDRDYLFGRLLAVADVLERSAMGRDENRATNALRYMNIFQSNPLRTWCTIEKNLHPYKVKLGYGINRYIELFEEIHDKFDDEKYNNKPLSGKFLLGYYSQRKALYTKKDEVIKEDNE